MSKNINLNKDEAISEIIDRITKGESLRSILPVKKRPEHLPALKTFLDWVAQDDNLSKHYARACEVRADLMFEEMFEIADDSTNDYMLRKIGNDEVEVENKEVIARSRLRIDTRKWALSKMNPKKYGDALKLSGDNDSPIQVKHTVDLTKLNDEELRTILELQRKVGISE